MGRFTHAEAGGETHEADWAACEAWAAAIESADLAADCARAFGSADVDAEENAEENEDDLFALVARRPSRRLRLRH